ncbi:kinase subunit of RNA polymerase II carboxy-terminal domain kinase I [Basidiobolus ranarum]|uniref:Kinase subunit of RNA polymerase II carboxy-terminal domain kinase I n=1 Tax=Basidiobolus ranarum TaxID=34480 RepID=A0ABR2WBD6_9FUNG
MDSHRRSSHRYSRSRSPPQLSSRHSSSRRDRDVDRDRTTSRKGEREGSSYHSARSNSHYSPDRNYRSRSRSRQSRDVQSKRKPQVSRSDHYSPPKNNKQLDVGTNSRTKVEPIQSNSGRDSLSKISHESKENQSELSKDSTSSRRNRSRLEESEKQERTNYRSTERATKKVVETSIEYTVKTSREYSQRASNGTISRKQESSDYLEYNEGSRHYKKRESTFLSSQHSYKKLKQPERVEKYKQASNSVPSKDRIRQTSREYPKASDNKGISKENLKTSDAKSNTKIDLYEKLEQVGEGTYGKVFKARNIISNTVVALKRIKVDSEKDGFPLTALREIKLLQSLKHPNIIQLPEIAYHKGSLYMVFEYMDYDLTGFLAHPSLSLSPAHIKRLMIQILRGIKYLHENEVLHRDLKASNLLLNKSGQLKLADFGLARVYEKHKSNQYTNRVITLWYRPPELLLGGTKYGPEVDMWSVGCIMMELFLRKPLFQGKDEISQLQSIYDLLGTPSPESWPTITSLPWYRLVKPKEAKERRFEKDFRDTLSPEAYDLATALLSMDPSKRPSAGEALRHKYFTSEQPNPCDLKDFPKLEGDWHEFEAKEMRKKNQKQCSNDSLTRSTHEDSHTNKPSKPPKDSKRLDDPHVHRSKNDGKDSQLYNRTSMVSGNSRSPKSTSHRRMISERKEIS